MSWEEDRFREQQRIDAGLPPMLGPISEGARAARINQQFMNPATPNAASQGAPWPPVTGGMRSGNGTRNGGAGGLVALLLVVVFGVAPELVTWWMAELAGFALLVGAALLPAILGTLIFGPRRPFWAMLRKFLMRVLRTVLAVAVAGVMVGAGFACLFALNYLTEAGLLLRTGPAAETLKPGWPMAWLVTAGTSALLVFLSARVIWRIVTGLGHGWIAGVLATAALAWAIVEVEAPSTLDDARALEARVDSMLSEHRLSTHEEK